MSATETTSKEKLKVLQLAIDRLEKTDVKLKRHRTYSPLFYVPLFGAFALLLLELLLANQLDTATASMAKYWVSDLENKVIDECVQLFGGYGYMWEYPVARAFADARVQRIYGGTNEIMKEVIARSMGLSGR